MKQVFTARKFKKMPKKKRWLRLGLKISGALAAVGVIVVIAIFAYFAKDLPGPDKINNRFVAQSTKIYDRTGEVLLYDIHGEEKRTVIPFEEIPQNAINATLALEDQNFYSHIGVDIKAVVRAALSQIFNLGTRSGGSTITQQFIKNSILTSERTLTRKIKEVILSIELEAKFSKDEILAMYLNEIPYGSNAYGIEAAAQTFFNKNAKDLTIDEAAMLAALPQAPSRYSPYGSRRETLQGRQELAINNMASAGFISQEEADAAIATDTFTKIAQLRENINAPHFVIYTQELLEEQYGAETLEKNGLTVITTIDWELQQAAEEFVREGAAQNEEAWNAENAALVAIDPKTGNILAMVGSRNFFDTEIDGQVNVAIAQRQPGSSFKPYVYLEAYRKGYTPETMLFDVPTNFANSGSPDYTPQNFDGGFRGLISMKKALGQSLNIPAVKALYLSVPKDAIRLAKRMGITDLNQPERYGLSLVLGGGEVKLLDHVAAFSVLGNNGVRHPAISILSITDGDGNVIEEYKQGSGEKIIDEEHITMLNESLSVNKHRAPAFGTNNPLRFDDVSVAAKTGTTNEFRDGWTIGYTSDIAVGVWAGNNDNRPMRAGAVGATVAAPIWRQFIEKTLERGRPTNFKKYDAEDVRTERKILDGELEIADKKIDVCDAKGDNWCLESDACPKKKEKRRLFIDVHNILYYVDRSDPRGDRPKNPKSDPQYKLWEDGLKNFYESRDNKVIFDEAPDRKCKDSDF